MFWNPIDSKPYVLKFQLSVGIPMPIFFCIYFLQSSNQLDDFHLTEGESFSLVFSFVHAYPGNLEILWQMLTHCFLRFLAVLASFPVAIIKHPDESDLGEKGSFVHYNSDYSSSLWVRNRGRGLRKLVTLHPQSRSREERINACFCSVHSLHSYTVRFPAQGLMLPTVGGSSHKSK